MKRALVSVSATEAVEAPANPVVVGKFGSAHGVGGWIKVFSSTEEKSGIFDYQPWLVKCRDKWHLIVLEAWKYHGQIAIAKIQAIHDRDVAAQLTNCEILVEASQLPVPEPGRYYWKDLIDCEVVTVCGYFMGRVVNLIETGSNDVLVVKANLNDAYKIQERLIPFLEKSVIKSVDLTARKIEVDWAPDF